jgi:hypothetical protein
MKAYQGHADNRSHRRRFRVFVAVAAFALRAVTPIRRSIPADGTPTAILTIPPATHRTKPGSGEGDTN